MKNETKNDARKQTLSRNLHSLMTLKRVNQSELSRETGVPQPTISRMLSCASTPRITSLQDIAEYFGVGLDYITGKNNLFDNYVRDISSKGNLLDMEV
tara:strand:+ start:215 stop:508 length:294 start_codon:yes stop_codon:yes gene_type:complete